MPPKLSKGNLSRIERGLSRKINIVRAFLNSIDNQDPSFTQKLSVQINTLKDSNDMFSQSLQLYFDAVTLPDDLSIDQVIELEERYSIIYDELLCELQLHLTPPSEGLHGPAASSTRLSVDTHSSFLNTSLATLPKFDLPKYDGNFIHFDAFISRFESLIDSNPSLSNVQKFQFLLTSLDNHTLSLINHLSLNDANYTIALNLLKERFEHKTRLVSFHCTNLLNLPSVQANSAQSLRLFLDQFNSNFNALSTIPSIDPVNAFMTSFLFTKMDSALKTKFESANPTSHSFPSSDILVRFLTSQAVSLENASLLPELPGSKPPVKFITRSLPRNVTSLVTSSPLHPPLPLDSAPVSTIKCLHCNADGHKIYSCSSFLAKTPRERFNFTSNHKLCTNCLGSHSSQNCASTIRCKTCSKPHHSLLHFGNEIPSNPSFSPPAGDSLVQPSSSSLASSLDVVTLTSAKAPFIGGKSVLLATCLVKLQISSNNYIVVRAILDTASQASFISEHCAQTLNCTRSAIPIPISGVGLTPALGKGFTSLDLFSLSGTPIVSAHPFIIMSHITSPSPSLPLSPSVRASFNNYLLADPTFDEPAPIQCLLGADVVSLILKGPPLNLGPELPHLIPSTLGYVVMGSVPSLSPVTSSCITQVNSFSYSDHTIDPSNPFISPITALSVSLSDTLPSLLRKFWEIEQPPTCVPPHPDEEQCETLFNTTTTQHDTGRFCVNLPFKIDPPPLGDSYSTAFKRLLALERKFNFNPSFHSKYLKYMSDYAEKGHMIPLETTQSARYFIPHHGIFKSHGDTQKLRVVFDASSKSSSGASLNDLLLSGPKLQSHISDVITLFRHHRYVFTCDIEQMFRQIDINPQDQLYQCILWRDHPSKPVQIFKLTTVTFGLTSSPYLALRTLRELAVKFNSQFPQAAQLLLNNTFVDDISGGADTIGQVIVLRNELIQLLSKGSFTLKKWTANHPQILDDLSPSIVEPSLLSSSTVNLLGLCWDLQLDQFRFVNPISTCVSHLSKRLCLAQLAQLYDPVGWISPIVMIAKVFMQRLWLLPLSWDDPLPNSLSDIWTHFVNSLSDLNNFIIPRLLFSSHQEMIIFGFSDACKSGYSAVLYAYSPSSVATPLLLTSKTRVAPLKILTIPRLELMGALMLAQLSAHFHTLLSPYFLKVSVFLFSDSSIVLSWLKIPPYRLKTFVGNRVAQILELTSPNSWHHVSTSSNPADIACRGTPPLSLVNNSLWMHGPSWLPSWSPPNVPSSLQADENIIKTEVLDPSISCSVAVTLNSPAEDLFRFISSWATLVSTVSCMLRWPRSRPFSSKVTSYTRATNSICIYIQSEVFGSLVACLNSNRPLPKQYRRLALYLDVSGVIRVGGRQASIHHPILLPKRHRLVNLLIDFTHETLLHAGPALVQSHLSNRYWILSARQIIRSRIHSCIRCFSAAPPISAPLMGDLPPARVTPSSPFSHTGMDFAGPFPVKATALRKASILKSYLCIFICFATKAIHLEVAEDLSTAAFLDVFKRFCSRRGMPGHLYSDCGTNFVGAEAVLRKHWLNTLKTSDSVFLQFLNLSNIVFHFNPPNAPHQGGLWERAVRSTKFLLTRIVGDQIPTLSQFSSLIVRIESVLNSRPLTPLSSDPTDLQVLTPSHFLIGRPLLCPPEPNLEDSSPGLLTRFAWVQAHFNRFWTRWHAEYLPTLQSRSKWDSHSKNLTVGDLVLLHEPNAPPLSWPRGRITAVFPGSNNTVRRVEVTTNSGTYLRPAVRVFRLPIFS